MPSKLKKINLGFERKKSDYDKYEFKMSGINRSILFGRHTKVKRLINDLEFQAKRNIIKMFYVYLKIKIQQKDQCQKELQTVYEFMNKSVFGSMHRTKEYDVDNLKKLLKKCFEIFMEDIASDHVLSDRLREITGIEDIIYKLISDYEKSIIKSIQDYIDFLYLFYVSKELRLDPLNSTQTASRKTKIKDQVLERKMHLLDQTMSTIQRDLALYLSDERYKDVKQEIMKKYNLYYRKLDRYIHLKVDFLYKTRTHKKFFIMVDELHFNWLCNCADTKGIDSKEFYVYIYDIVMYKYRLLTYFYLNKAHEKKRKYRVIKLLEKNKLIENEKTFYFFNEHIRSEKDINAHIIRLFEKRYWYLAKIILAIKTRTPHNEKNINSIFNHLPHMKLKQAPLLASREYPIQITAEEHFRYKML